MAAMAGVGLNSAFLKAQANPSEMTSFLGSILTGGVGALLLGLGLLFGARALFQAHRNRRLGILAVALGGVLLNSLFLGLFGWELYRNHSRTAAREKFHEEALAVSPPFAASSSNSGAGTALEAARLAQLRHELERAAQELPGDDERLAKASTSYLARLQARIGEYNRSLRALRQAEILELRTIQTREQLQARRKLVQEFLTANGDYGNFQANAENHFRDELLSQKVSPKAQEQALREFEARMLQRHPLALEIRSADAQWGNAILGIIDLLDTNWGDWAYDPLNEAVTFQDDLNTSRYEAFLDAMDAAAETQTAVQQRALDSK